MQCNQPYFFTGPPQCTQYFTATNTPTPQMCNPPFNDIIGEGEITTVVMSDGSIQYFFLPIQKWSHFPQNASMSNCSPYWNTAPGVWFIRGFSNVCNQQPNSLFGCQRGFACNSNMALPPAGFQVKFHQDGITSTTDLFYFCPQLRSNRKPLQSSGVQVHVPEVRSTQCQPDGGDVTRRNSRHVKTGETCCTQTDKNKCECNKGHSKRNRRKESHMSMDDDYRSRKKGRNNCESNTSIEDMSIDGHENNNGATSSGTASSSSLCSMCLDDRRKIKAIKSLEKEQKEREKEAKKREKKWLNKQKEKEEAKRMQQDKSMKSYDSEDSNCTCSTSLKLGDAFSSTQYSMCTDIEMASNNDTNSAKRERELYQYERDFIRTLEMDQKRLEEEKKRLEKEKRELEIEKIKLEKEQSMARASIYKYYSNENGYQKAHNDNSSFCCPSSKNEDIFGSAQSTFCNDIEMRSDKNGEQTKNERDIMNNERKLLNTLESEQKRLQKERRKLEIEKTNLETKMSQMDKEWRRESKPLIINESFTKLNPSQKAVNNTDEKQRSEKANNSYSKEWEKSVQSDVSKTSCSCRSMTIDSSFSKIGGDFSSSENISDSDKTSNGKNAADVKLEKELIKREKKFLKMLEIEQKRLAKEKLLLEKKKAKLEKKSGNEKFTSCECKSGTNSNPKADSYVSAMSVEKVDGSTTDDYSLLTAPSHTQHLKCMCEPPPPTCDRMVETNPKQPENTTQESDHFRFNVFPFTTNLASYKSRLEKISRELCTHSYNSERIEFD